MVDETLIAYFKLAHGFFNLAMFTLFCYQGWLGLKIRRARLAGDTLSVDAARRHRTAGPVFALWGSLGFIAGAVMVLLDKGRVFEYPLHFLTGGSIVCLIVALFLVSRRIQGGVAPYRDVHFWLGMLLLALYVIQSFLGLAILL